MGFTFAEKIIAGHAGHEVHANDCVVVNVDVMMASDTTGPMTIRAFQEMGGVRVAKPKKTVFVIDHATPCPNERIAALHSMIRRFCGEQGCVLYDQNWGVCHQVMLENDEVGEGDLVLGGDSHTCSYGAVGAFSTGVGSTDLGAALLTGKTWLRVPETSRIELTGHLPKGVCAKDVTLRMIGDLRSDGVSYESVEFAGDGFARFTQDEAATVCNMVIEMGGKNGVFLSALKRPDLMPDEDAVYKRVLRYDAAAVVPMVARPHAVDNVCTAAEAAGQRIDMVYIGSCTNGRLSDLAAAADILRGKKIAPSVRMTVCPASTKVLLAAIDRGYIREFLEAGATISTPGCSLCVGTLGGVPADGEVVLSTTNRNFKGRMGNKNALIYLASPATAAASALTGTITDPREVI
ncbi:3-isopropylmalate dehydratase large subunit [Oscillibacter hominis]|uniref:3-isopropylmalate dehydratase large subunit n=1 Tax=Oscillibacter hominis TaxID=2763056 RepID=A0A7G9B4Y3_9FIRM|nr:aconitase/3-isopropylmalate dehydratase large subunit family protein [Oscillibacter hominis]QNL44614.1 3-isopropylmalate dehydratase large subunit [Oscillibacter hominis]